MTPEKLEFAGFRESKNHPDPIVQQSKLYYETGVSDNGTPITLVVEHGQINLYTPQIGKVDTRDLYTTLKYLYESTRGN